MNTIKTDLDYEKALKRIEELVDLDPEKDTPEAGELGRLTSLVNSYEDAHFPLPSKGHDV